MTQITSTIRASVVAGAMLLAFAGPVFTPSAHAGGKPKVNFTVHIGSGGPVYGNPYGYGGYYGYRNPCGWLKRRWLRTGNPKWHWRYKKCMWGY